MQISLIKKMDEYRNNPEKLSTTKVGEYIPLGFLMPTISLFKPVKNEHNVYRGEDCMKKFCGKEDN